MTRNKKVVDNIISNIVVQIIVVITGLILPKFILFSFGSTINGMVGSIGQFLAYAGLVEMGIGNASIAVLYEPIAQKDNDRISIIMSSVKKKYLISGCLYTVIIVGLAIIYPLLITGQLDYWFVFSMVIILACTSIIDLFIIGKYKVLLIADQRNYILNSAKVLTIIITTILSCLILVSGASLMSVKIIAVFMHLCEAVFIKCYVGYHYPNVDYDTSDYIKLEQQKNALIHQICMIITYNTDRIVLTLFVCSESLKVVSVYSMYALVYDAVSNGMSCFTTGMEAVFGNMIAKKEFVKLQKTFALYETIYIFITYLFYSCFLVLIVPFIRCYTRGVTDINYIQLDVGILFGISGIFANLKDAHKIILKAYGYYKQTQKYVIAEAVVNIIVSVMLVPSMGIVGVLVGTIVSHLITSIGFPYYVDKYLLSRKPYQTFKDNFINIAIVLILVMVEINAVYYISDWNTWAVSAVGIFVVNAVGLCGMNAVTNQENFNLVVEYCREKIFRSKR